MDLAHLGQPEVLPASKITTKIKPRTTTGLWEQVLSYSRDMYSFVLSDSSSDLMPSVFMYNYLYSQALLGVHL